MALRTRRISFILHLSEVRLTTRPVISMDMDGLRCIPIDPIGFHSTNRYRRIQSDNISTLWFSSDFRYFFRVKRILLPLEGVTNRILPIPSENYVSHWCVLEMYGKKLISTLFFLFLFFFFVTTWVKEKQHRKLGKGNEIRNNRDMISGEV